MNLYLKIVLHICDLDERVFVEHFLLEAEVNTILVCFEYHSPQHQLTRISSFGKG